MQSQCFAKPKVSIGSMTDEFMLLLVLFTVLFAVQIVESTSTTWSISVVASKAPQAIFAESKLLPFELGMFAKP